MAETIPSLDTRRPFTRADALAAGIPARELRGSRFRRIFTGVYVDARVGDHPVVTAQALLAIHPREAFVSHLTAARVYRLPVPAMPDEHVTVPTAADRSKRDGVVCHVARSDDVVEVDGFRISAPHRLFVELAAVLSLVDLVVVGDALVRMRRVTPASLREACAASTDRFAGCARRAASYVRSEVDSAMETRLRLLLVLAGLPEPEVNHKILDGRGRVTRRFDLSYPSVRLVVEYDGRQHVEVRANWASDLRRREELDESGWRIIVVTAEGIYREPEKTVERVRRALADRGWQRLRVTDAWRAHFRAR